MQTISSRVTPGGLRRAVRRHSRQCVQEAAQAASARPRPPGISWNSRAKRTLVSRFVPKTAAIFSNGSNGAGVNEPLDLLTPQVRAILAV